MNLSQMFAKMQAKEEAETLQSQRDALVVAMRRLLVRRIASVAAEAQDAFWMVVSGHVHSDLPMPEDFKDSFEWMVAKYIAEVRKHEQ